MRFVHGGKYSFTRDLKATLVACEKYKNCMPLMQVIKDGFPDEERLPPMVGMIWLGKISIYVTSVECLQDLYINKNAGATKHWVP